MGGRWRSRWAWPLLDRPRPVGDTPVPPAPPAQAEPRTRDGPWLPAPHGLKDRQALPSAFEQDGLRDSQALCRRPGARPAGSSPGPKRAPRAVSRDRHVRQ